MRYFLKAWPVMALATVVFTVAWRITRDVGCLYLARACAYADIGMVVWGLLLIVSQPRRSKHGRRG